MLTGIFRKIARMSSAAKARRYIDPSLGIEGFFKKLKAKKVQYVVLRWFEDLPRQEPGEDIDLLVRDEDIPAVTALFNGRKRDGIACDLYSESGLQGSSFRGMAYYPPQLAKAILANAAWKDDLFRVPDAEHHFLSMGYHALYHKGELSGIPNAYLNEKRAIEHDYLRELTRIAEACNIVLPEQLTLESLDDLLGKKGWRPSMDTLEKLAGKNGWIREHFFTKHPDDLIEAPFRGICVFIIRESAEDQRDVIGQQLYRDGFDIILSQKIPASGRKAVARHMRGGNWKQGPWPAPGGLPAAFFVLMDVDPLHTTDKKILTKHAGLTNYRVHKSKLLVRKMINQNKPRKEWSNCVHSSDNARQAMEYIALLCPNAGEEIREQAKALFFAFQNPYPVMRRLGGTARRAKVEKVNYHGKPAVCKMFRQGRERFMQREVKARELARGNRSISRILEIGKNYLIIEWIDDHSGDFYYRVPPWGCKMLPVAFLYEAGAVISHFRRQGHEYVDFTPRNLLITEEGRIKVIDFEFLQYCGNATAATKGNYAWYPAPDFFSGDLPERYEKGSPYRKWKRVFGVPLLFAEHRPPQVLIYLAQVMYGFYLVQRKWSEKPEEKRLWQ